MKKLIALILVLTLSLTVALACDETPEFFTITVNSGGYGERIIEGMGRFQVQILEGDVLLYCNGAVSKIADTWYNQDEGIVMFPFSKALELFEKYQRMEWINTIRFEYVGMN